MGNEIIFIIEEAPEGGFTAKALGQSIFTEADDLDHLREQIREAVRCHFDEGDAPDFSLSLAGSGHGLGLSENKSFVVRASSLQSFVVRASSLHSVTPVRGATPAKAGV